MYLTSYQETREQLEQVQNPLFLYDNDTDGLCSFVLIRRWLGRGEGVAVKSYPDLSEQYLDKVDKINADSVVVLDIHALSSDFVEGINKRGLNIIWIDHHQVKDLSLQQKSEFVFYFNPLYTIDKESNGNPTSFQAYKIAQVENDSWISLVGCIADCFLPDFKVSVAEKYPTLWGKKNKTPFDAYYNTEFGRIALMLNFGLKDIPSKVKEIQDFLIECTNPEDALSESSPIMKEKSAEIYKKYNQIVNEAEEGIVENTLFYLYSGETSMSSEISNALVYKYPKKYIAIAYKRQGIVNISMRGKNIKLVLDKILSKIPNSTGGGHNDAVGARVSWDKIKEFENIFREEVSKI